MGLTLPLPDGSNLGGVYAVEVAARQVRMEKVQCYSERR